ncbi:hypothetical protein C7M61_005097 [Candidozyma pseudohaemuli]|uniref:Uncharacterized protein n=1 Tax=Candidozyma pseudohaemuli TaxID=418784 RepID=A0A2P7YD84_9ASCO|nr:hypothetical protein C7M61_005097 [[Candida] pseudohaemulonii]PSK33905.1 hypothetical protein C7M61_005097 [[Candida] pseudohaemulonii]
MCPLCRKIGIIELPIAAHHAFFFLDGSVYINHGSSTLPIWKDLDEFFYFHTLLMVGRTNYEAGMLAQHLWNQRLEECEVEYRKNEKRFMEMIEKGEFPGTPNYRYGEDEGGGSPVSSAGSVNQFNGCGLSKGIEKKESGEEVPRKIYGLPSPEKLKTALTKSQKKKLAKSKRSVAKKLQMVADE